MTNGPSTWSRSHGGVGRDRREHGLPQVDDRSALLGDSDEELGRDRTPSRLQRASASAPAIRPSRQRRSAGRRPRSRPGSPRGVGRRPSRAAPRGPARSRARSPRRGPCRGPSPRTWPGPPCAAVSRRSSSGPPNAMPPLALRGSRCPATTAPCWVAASTRSHTCSTSNASASSIRTANSSPPSRATVSPSRTQDRSLSASSTRTASPAAWPNRSLTGLNPSRSMKSSVTRVPFRRAFVCACFSRSSRMPRLGRSVSGSWRATWIISSVSASRAKASDATAASAFSACSSAATVERARPSAFATSQRGSSPSWTSAPISPRSGGAGADRDLLEVQQLTRVVDQRGHDQLAVRQRLRPDRSVEEDRQAAFVLAGAGHRAGRNEQRAEGYGEQDQHPPGFDGRPPRPGSRGVERHEAGTASKVPRCSRWRRTSVPELIPTDTADIT